MSPPVPSRQMTLYEVSEEEEFVSEEEVSDYEDDELTKKSQTELEKMLVNIKSEVVLAETKLKNTGKKVLKELLRDESITKEQQTMINSVFVRTKELSNEEMIFFKMVVDAEIATKQVPAEIDNLLVMASRVEFALEDKVEEMARKRKAKLSRRIDAKVSKVTPIAKRRK
eukprot:5320654-Prymnesium_polylepis.1